MNRTFVAGALAVACLTSIAQADIFYVDIAGHVTVNGQPAEGVTVEAIPCVGALLPSDWPSPNPFAISTIPALSTDANYHVFFLSQYGDGSFPGAAGSHTFLAGNGAWFTAASVGLQFTYSNCTPVIVSCSDVLAAYQANPSPIDPFNGIVNVNIVCRQFNPGDTATMGFWANKNGQALIKSLNGGSSSTALGNWLASSLPYLFGANAGANNLTGKSNLSVATLYAKLASVSGTKLEAQIMATALAVYVTDSDLAGNAGIPYGFNVSSTGLGAKTYYVGANGSAIGLINNTDYTVAALLLDANLQKQAGTFNRNAFNLIFSDINVSGSRQ
jgi:hypothetical protein